MNTDDFAYLKNLRRWWISQGHVGVPDVDCSCGYLGDDAPPECVLHGPQARTKACAEELVQVLQKHGMVLVTKSWEYPVLGFRRRKKRSGKDCEKMDARLQKALVESENE